LGKVIEEDELGNLSGLSGTGLTNEDQDLRLLIKLQELIAGGRKSVSILS
jgi:hypothetical protein